MGGGVLHVCMLIASHDFNGRFNGGFFSDPYGCDMKKRKIESQMKTFSSFSQGAMSFMNRPKAVPSTMMNQRIKIGKTHATFHVAHTK